MFGSCVLNKRLCLLFIALLFPVLSWAAAQQATVITDGALIYQDADFDAPVIQTLKRGGVYNISTGKKGPFYKIRLKPGTVGWIADTDLKMGVVKLAPPPEEKKLFDKKEERKKPFFATRYRGPALDFINFTEDTLGKERSEYLPFYGVKFNGFNTIISGEIYAEGNIMFHVGAPSYYTDVTKKSADGFIFISNFLLQTVSPMSKSNLFYYGFGPMFKYSHFTLEVPNGTKTLSYSADDMNLGAVFNVGMAFRLGSLSLRTDAKYYWERVKYYGFGLNLGWEF
ncbi:SH3 domain-containing protein [uncultured Bdellovibrio sp.]|uniref:SH3 domain-containing protein n=1 Tax=Bdellovibrio sp. HCB-162 TaxID=3394234 RepID=UPI0025E08861|nr:SH3 domain-containing protein [uncultured Bdellovibrio sp.]